MTGWFGSVCQPLANARGSETSRDREGAVADETEETTRSSHYYNSLGGSYLFTVYGEGPVDNGALSFVTEIYEGNVGLWAGVFGPSATFEERLNGQLYISGVPEPSVCLLTLCGIGLLVIARRSRLAAR